MRQPVCRRAVRVCPDPEALTAAWKKAVDRKRFDDALLVDSAGRARKVRTVRVLGNRGGSHTGELMPARIPGGLCPLDGAALQRRQVGGRTTYSCPVHQL